MLFLTLLLFSLNTFTQTIINKHLKNGNSIYFNKPIDLYPWTDTSIFNPSSLLKDGDYNIACYTIIPSKLYNLVQVYGFRQYSNNFLTSKEFNTQLVSIFKKKLNDSVSIPHDYNSTLSQIIEKYISQFSLEKQKELRMIVDTALNDLNKEKHVKATVELFHESPNSIILGIVTKFQLPSLAVSYTSASFSGCILLRNHAYGFTVFFSEDDSSFEQKTKITKTFISNLENLNPSN